VLGGADAELEAEEELGGDVALEVVPELELDLLLADADVDADEEGVNEAKERLVGVDAAAQNCSTSVSAVATSEGQALRQLRRVVV